MELPASDECSMDISPVSDPSQAAVFTSQVASQGQQIALLRKAQEQPAQDVDQLIASTSSDKPSAPPPFPSNLGREVDISA